MKRPSDPSERRRVTVVGAGIAGLGSALALSAAGFDVTVLDKDSPLPESSNGADPSAPDDVVAVMNEVFRDWQRPGVSQLRHSHVFLARLRNLIRDRYPRLLDQLMDAGCRELRFVDGLPGPLRADYQPHPADDDLTILSSRRTTLEYALRRYVQNFTEVSFETQVRVTGIRLEQASSALPLTAAVPRLVGLEVERGARSAAEGRSPTRETIETSVVVDASGRTTVFPRLLAEQGIELPVDARDAGILYFTRHYRLLPGCEEPARGKIPGNGDLGYIKYGVFPADNGCFSITLALPEDELELRKQIVKPESFDFICSQLPGVARFTDPERSEPNSKVYGMGNLRSEWRNYLDESGDPRVLGLYAVGDSLIRSNPLYGRGCSSGVLAGHLLADALLASDDDTVCLKSYFSTLETEIRPHFESMRRQDLSAIKRARNEKDKDYRPSFKARLAKRFIEDALAPTLRGDIAVLRAFMPGFHMLAPPELWLKRPSILLRIARVWLRGRRRNRALGLYLPELGPEREAMCRLLGVR